MKSCLFFFSSYKCCINASLQCSTVFVSALNADASVGGTKMMAFGCVWLILVLLKFPLKTTRPADLPPPESFVLQRRAPLPDVHLS